MASPPKWVAASVVLAVHDAQIAEHGGGAGVRDENLLHSALARPQNFWAYEQAALAQLAASYAFGLCANHPFVDGNKRTSLVVMEVFLALNGQALTASDADCVMVWENLAAGRLDEPELALWIGQNLAPIDR